MTIGAASLVRAGEGDVYELGVASMRVLLTSKDTGGTVSLAEFSGKEGLWTVPHVHRLGSESFYVVSGRFTFTVGGESIEAGPGDFVLVPPDTEHTMGGASGGGTVLVAWSPAGLEKMFVELSALSPEAIVDPAVRAEIASRHDSHPVEQAPNDRG